MVGLTRVQAAKILGVAEDAGEIEIRVAYKQLALTWHPDKNKSAEATEKFKEINAAHKRMQRPDSDDEIDFDEDIAPFEEFMDMISTMMAQQAMYDRRAFGGGPFGGGGLFGGRSGGFGGGSCGHSHAAPHVHFASMGGGRGGFMFVPVASDSSSEYETDTEDEDEEEKWKYRRGQQRKAEAQRAKEAAERRKAQDEAARKKHEAHEARRRAELKAKHEAEEALKRQKKEEKARQKERQVAGAKERAEQEAREKEEALQREKKDAEKRRREEQSRRDKAKAKEQAEAAARAQAEALAAEAAARREKRKVQQPKPLRKRGSGKGTEEDEEDVAASSNPFAALKPETKPPSRVKKAVKTKDLPPEDEDEADSAAPVPRVSGRAAAPAQETAAFRVTTPAVNAAAKLVQVQESLTERKVMPPDVEEPKPKTLEELASEKEAEREKEARRKRSKEEAARKRAQKAAQEKLMQKLEEKKRVEEEDCAIAMRLQAEEERLARIEAYQRQQRVEQQKEEARKAASRQFAGRRAPGSAAVAQASSSVYATTTAAAAALSQQGPPTAPLAEPAVHLQPAPSVEQPTAFGARSGFGDPPTGSEEPAAHVSPAVSEPMDPAVASAWKMETDRLEAGRRLDEERRRKVEEQKRKKEEDERLEAERRRRAEEALLRKAELGAQTKKVQRRRRRGAGQAGVDGLQGWGAEYGSSEWGAGSAYSGTPPDANEWEDVHDEEEADFEAREREAELLREEERRREERKQQQQQQQQAMEEGGSSESDITSILAEIASRAEEEHRASPTSPLESISAASNGSPDVHVHSDKGPRPVARYAPYQPLKQAGGLQRPSNGPPMRTEADILSEVWGQEAPKQAEESRPIDPMELLRQLSQGRSSTSEQQSSAYAPAANQYPTYVSNTAHSQPPSPYPAQFPHTQSAGSYSSSQPAAYYQTQAPAYGAYQSNYSNGAPPTSASAYPGTAYPTSEYPAQTFSHSTYPGYHSSSATTYEKSLPEYAAAPQGAYAASAVSQQLPTYPQIHFVTQDAAVPQAYGGGQDGSQFSWQGQYASSGPDAGLPSSEQYTPSTDTASPPDTAPVTQPTMREGASEYWVNDRADASGGNTFEEGPAYAVPDQDAYYRQGSARSGQQEWQGSEGERWGNAPTGWGEQQTGEVNDAKAFGSSGPSYSAHSSYGGEDAPTGWGPPEQEEAQEKRGGAFVNGGSYASSKSSFEGSASRQETRFASPQYSSWGGEESQKVQASGWGGQASMTQDSRVQKHEAKDPKMNGFGHATWQQQSEAYPDGSISGSSVSGGTGRRQCRFFQRGACRYGQRCKDLHTRGNGVSKGTPPTEQSAPFRAAAPAHSATAWGSEAAQHFDKSAGFNGLRSGGPKKAPYESGDVRKPGAYESAGPAGDLNSSANGGWGYAGPARHSAM